MEEIEDWHVIRDTGEYPPAKPERYPSEVTLETSDGLVISRAPSVTSERITVCSGLKAILEDASPAGKPGQFLTYEMPSKANSGKPPLQCPKDFRG